MKRKKLMTILTLSFLSLICLFADYTPSLRNNLQIFGHIDEFCLLVINPIDANSAQSEGMPFNILDPGVQYNVNTMGRRIALWTFTTNRSSITVSFDAGPLTNTSYPEETVDYWLTFRYDYPNADNMPVTGTITVGSGVTNNPTTLLNDVDIPIISIGKDIRFMFTDDDVDLEGLHDGYFSATVIITVEV